MIHGDGTDPDFLALTGIYPQDILILTTSRDEVNLMIAGLARSIFDVDRIIAKLNDSAHAKAYEEMEIRAVDFLRQGSLAMENVILRPNIFDVLIQEESGNEVMEAAMKSTALKGRALSKIRPPGNSLILFVKRGGDTIIPHGNTRLYEDDIIALCGDCHSVRKARRLFEMGESL